MPWSKDNYDADAVKKYFSMPGVKESLYMAGLYFSIGHSFEPIFEEDGRKMLCGELWQTKKVLWEEVKSLYEFKWEQLLKDCTKKLHEVYKYHPQLKGNAPDEVKWGDFMRWFRLAITGKTTGFSIYETIAILGRGRVLNRVLFVLKTWFRKFFDDTGCYLDEDDEPDAPMPHESEKYFAKHAPEDIDFRTDLQTPQKEFKEFSSWALKFKTMREVYDECQNSNWLMQLYVWNQGGYGPFFPLVGCQSVRDEIWPFLHVNKEGIVGGDTDQEKVIIGPLGSCWSVPAHDRYLIWNVEQTLCPWLRKTVAPNTFDGPPIPRESGQLLTKPRWNVFNLARNACRVLVEEDPRIACWECLRYIQQTVGLLAVLNAAGITPKEDQEVIMNKLEDELREREEFVTGEHQNKPVFEDVYDKAVALCQARQANLIRKMVCFPWTSEKKSGSTRTAAHAGKVAPGGG